MNFWDRYEQLAPFWHLLLVGLILVSVAGSVNRFAPQRRPVLRRALGLFLLYALSVALDSVPSLGVLKYTSIAHELLESLTLVHLGAIGIFDLALPLLGIELAAITVDLMLAGAYAMTGFAVLTASGVELSSVVAASTVVAAILTIALQSTLGNVLGGLTVQLDKSIQKGEWVRLENGREGRVAEVGWRHTVLETRDGDAIVVPNVTLLGSAFTILGKRDGRPHPHRMSVTFHVDFRFGPGEVCRAVHQAMLASPLPNMAAEPAPDVVCLDLGRENRDTVGIYAVRYWILDPLRDEATSSEVRSRIHAALRRNGIPFGRPSVTYFNVATDEDSEHARLRRRRHRAVLTLRELSLFHGLTHDEQARLAEQLQYAPFSAGEFIARQGAPARSLYILQRGTVEVRILAKGEERRVTTLEAPTFFGEMALMTGESRQASVVATTDVVCYRLEKAALDALIRARPAIAEGMSVAIAERSMQLQAFRNDLDAAGQQAREASERERILAGIRGFFGLDGS